MQKEMIENVTRRQAIEMMPWAAVIVKVYGGYMGFECVNDYKIWKNQK